MIKCKHGIDLEVYICTDCETIPSVSAIAPTIDNEEMLIRAMKKAVEVGIFPKHPVDSETYLKHWAGMQEVLKAAMDT